MPFNLADMVMQSTIGTGIGDLTLINPAVTGYVRFSLVGLVGFNIFYKIAAVDSNGNPTGVFEIGYGNTVLVSPPSIIKLVRTAVLANSNGDQNLIDFAAGTKYVSCVAPKALVSQDTMLHIGRVDSRYYHQFSGSVLSTFNSVANRLYAQPFFIDRPTLLTKLGIEVTSPGAGGTTGRLGLYSHGQGIPDALLLDAGTVTVDSNAVKEITISKLLMVGWYWQVLVSDGAPQYRGISNEKILETMYGGSNSSGGGSSNMIWAAFTFAELPATFPAITYDWNGTGLGIWTRSG